MAKFVAFSIVHIYREMDTVADALSKFSEDSQFGIEFMEQPPP